MSTQLEAMTTFSWTYQHGTTVVLGSWLNPPPGTRSHDDEERMQTWTVRREQKRADAVPSDGDGED